MPRLSYSLLLIIVPWVLIFIGCSHDDRTGSPTPDPVIDEPAHAQVKGYCDQPTPQGYDGMPYTHSSLAAIEDFTAKISVHYQKLLPAQCLAVAAYEKTKDWFGMGCNDRDITAAASWLKRCGEGEWFYDDIDHYEPECNLLNQGDLDMPFQSFETTREDLKNNFDDCSWRKEDQPRIITPEVIAEAIRVLAKPE